MEIEQLKRPPVYEVNATNFVREVMDLRRKGEFLRTDFVTLNFTQGLAAISPETLERLAEYMEAPESKAAIPSLLKQAEEDSASFNKVLLMAVGVSEMELDRLKDEMERLCHRNNGVNPHEEKFIDPPVKTDWGPGFGYINWYYFFPEATEGPE